MTAAKDVGVTNVIESIPFLMDGSFLTTFPSPPSAVSGEIRTASTLKFAAGLAATRLDFAFETEAVS